jgi:hypothetical protein
MSATSSDAMPTASKTIQIILFASVSGMNIRKKEITFATFVLA